MSPTLQENCANCGRSGATFRCVACTMVSYCDKYCEKAALSRHKGHCGNLVKKLIDRIGDTVQKVFQVFSEKAFEINVQNIVTMGNTIIVHEMANNVAATGRALFDFPSRLLPDGEAKTAVLGLGRGEQAVAYLHDFVAQLLKGSGQPLCVKVDR